jgi:hypothetical protein
MGVHHNQLFTYAAVLSGLEVGNRRVIFMQKDDSSDDFADRRRDYTEDQLALGLKPGFGLLVVVTIIFSAIVRAAYLAAGDGSWETLVDFHVFYISGLLVRDGLIDNAYSLEKMFEAQNAFAGSKSFMPWTYPPPFNLIVGSLATLPFVTAYIVFVLGSFIVYVLCLRLLSSNAFAFSIWACLPASLVMVICGQNGFLTSAIIGLFSFLYVRSSAWAGAVLGLMIIKPHLAVGVGIWLLFRMEIRTLLIAGAVSFMLCAIATLTMGPSVWTSFMGGVAEAGVFLKEGYYPLYRMTSIYAGMRSGGVQSQLSMTIQLAFAACAIFVIFLAARHIADQRTGLGLAIAGSFFISPYIYDYDLPMLAVALTLLWPRLSETATARTLVSLIVMLWVAGACGILSFLLSYWWTGDPSPQKFALGWLPMLGIVSIVLVKLRVPAGRVSAKVVNCGDGLKI